MPADRGTTGRSGELPVLADLPGYSGQKAEISTGRCRSARGHGWSLDEVWPGAANGGGAMAADRSGCWAVAPARAADG
jgi:hypothetical protein